jgi:dienelactone hydrolase
VAHVLLFHHALGLTDGVRAFADDLRAAGHEVTVPDLFDGRTFAALEDGVAHAEEVGFLTLAERGGRVADDLPADLVYAGFSLGVLPAQRAAQTRPGARAAVLYHGGVPVETFGEVWPPEVTLQLHVAEDDPWGDVEDVRQLAAAADGELFTYPGDAHLFTDRTLDVHDPDAAALVLERTLDLLARVDLRG